MHQYIADTRRIELMLKEKIIVIDVSHSQQKLQGRIQGRERAGSPKKRAQTSKIRGKHRRRKEFLTNKIPNTPFLGRLSKHYHLI